MFEGKSIWEIIQIGGFAMWILIACSILTLAVICERLVYFRKRSQAERASLMKTISEDIGKHKPEKALEICENEMAPFARVLYEGLRHYGDSNEKISNAMERQITMEIAGLEKYTSIVGTIGSTAVYIGLFGTVIGIIRAFRDISAIGGGGINIVIGGIAEALVSTAAGICIAVPCVMAYNYFMKRIDSFSTDMELCASELLDLLRKK